MYRTIHHQNSENTTSKDNNQNSPGRKMAPGAMTFVLGAFFLVKMAHNSTNDLIDDISIRRTAVISILLNAIK